MVLSDLDIGMNDWVVDQFKWDDNYSHDRGKLVTSEDIEKLKEMGILINGSYTDLRMVAHYGIDNKHIDKTIESMSKVMNSI